MTWRTDNGSAVVVARDLTRRYGEGDYAVDALRGVSVEIEPGQADRRDGAVRLRQVDADAHPRRARQADRRATSRSPAPRSRRLGDNDLTKLRREHIGFVFQFFNLLPMLTAQRERAAAAHDRRREARGRLVRRARRARSGSPTGSRTARPSSPAASSSASRSRARSSRARPSSSPTSRPGTSTRPRATRSSS